MTRKVGPYTINAAIRQGAVGTIYDAQDEAGQRVAVKVISLAAAQGAAAEPLERFRRAAEAARSLVHPHVVRILDAGEAGNDGYLVLEFIEGSSLAELLESGRRFTVEEALDVVASVLGGLSFAHASGLVHGALKPANLLVTKQGVVKVGGFGVLPFEGSNMTQTAVMIDPPAYMSPEQFLCEPLDARTDVYAAGVVLYRLLTGQVPFEGSVSAVMQQALHTVPAAPSTLSPDIPQPLDAVVARAIAREPAQRFANAAEFATALPQETLATVVQPAPASKVVPVNWRDHIARTNLAELPAYVPPPPVPPVYTLQDRVRAGARSLALFALIVGSALVAFDLCVDQPIGTLPNADNLTHVPPPPGGVVTPVRR